MRKADTAPDPRRYHHGDLRRGLVEAALALLEREGVDALSLRAVAREANVSPAAPYHHFKDKADLLDAVAHEGWAQLGEAMSRAFAAADTPAHQRLALGVAYVRFARAHRDLYRVMGDSSRQHAMDEHSEKESAGYSLVEQAIAGTAAEGTTPLDIQLGVIAAWAAAHGLAELAGFPQFETLKAELGGEEAFIEGVLAHLGMFRPG